MSATLTLEEQACNFATMQHIERVRNLINKVAIELIRRGEKHDQSKLEPPEVAAFTAQTPALAKLEFGTAEYEASKQQLGEALIHHYAKNRHHPEHHKDGVNSMNLVDILEMFIDWKAGSERQHNGNLKKSIEYNGNKFGLSPQLIRIFENSIDLLEG